jgi:hypothetical protein
METHDLTAPRFEGSLFYDYDLWGDGGMLDCASTTSKVSSCQFLLFGESPIGDRPVGTALVALTARANGRNFFKKSSFGNLVEKASEFNIPSKVSYPVKQLCSYHSCTGEPCHFLP